MPYLRLSAVSLLSAAVLLSACSTHRDVGQQADLIVKRMSTREKIGQKIMMAFRYWCPESRHPGQQPESQQNCTERMTALPDTVRQALRDNAIGGVVLLGKNMVDLQQTRRFTEQIRQASPAGSAVEPLIAVDAEGGEIFRLPRGVATAFPGNMALGAAYQATQDRSLAIDAGRVLAAEIRALGFNVNFAPVVDVNSNPLNPVVNVRAYGDDANTIGLLGSLTAQGARREGVISAFKHFPGHGDTAIDSHDGLPKVEKSKADAYATDLAPYRQAIESGQAPDMIMTAHIQYPALDDTLLATRSGEQIIAPATMSRKIQHDILRGEMDYRGVTISDSLYMKGISAYFDPADAVIKVFQADVDIALRPIEIYTPAEIAKLSQLINQVVAAVNSGKIDRAELDRSVTRIVAMKLRNGITIASEADSLSQLSIIGSPLHREVENRIVRQSVTLLHNEGGALPLRSPDQRIFILTPWGEQAEAMRRRFLENGYDVVSGAKFSAVPWETQQQSIDNSDVVIIGTMAAGEARQVRQAMEYAKMHGKTVIHVTLRAPYDVIDYDDIADATLATYAYYGYENGLRGPSLPVLVDVMVGTIKPMGKLPVNIHAVDSTGALGPIRYARGFGLRF